MYEFASTLYKYKKYNNKVDKPLKAIFVSRTKLIKISNGRIIPLVSVFFYWRVITSI